MRLRAAAFTLAVASLLTGLVAAGQFSGEFQETVVEKHTVFAVVERTDLKGGAWDIVVLVRDTHINRGGVLWFTDQWKWTVEDQGKQVRYPCGGYVTANVGGTSGLQYVESYHITDPNGFVSETHFYSDNAASNPSGYWVTGVQNAFIDDDGEANCDPQVDAVPHQEPGHNGISYDGGTPFLYNADLYGIFSDVLDAQGSSGGTVQHGDGGVNDHHQTGCEDRTEWDCNSNDREGNSHPYNPNEPDSGTVHDHRTTSLSVRFRASMGNFNPAGGFPPTNPYWRVWDPHEVEPDAPCEVKDGYHEHC